MQFCTNFFKHIQITAEVQCLVNYKNATFYEKCYIKTFVLPHSLYIKEKSKAARYGKSRILPETRRLKHASVISYEK